jgi:site-specific DNA recombinase
MKFERRMRLITAVARGRTWLNEIVSGAASGTQAIAKRHVEMTISLAFLAPVLVKAAPQ